MIKKYKWQLILGLVLLAAAIFLSLFFFGAKGKNSVRNRTIRVYDTVTSFVTVQGGHYLYATRDLFGAASNKNQIGWVSDIHADIFKRRTVDSGTLYPRQYSEYLNKVFNELREKKITTIVATGDNANSGDAEYGKELAKLAYAKNMHVLWVKGNHDKDGDMKELGFSDPNKVYYYQDFDKTRLVVLDDSQGDFLTGGINDEQMQWLRESLKTDKQVLIAMHIPIFPLSLTDDTLPHFVELEKIFHDNSNVKIVINGHFHTRWSKEFDGVKYYGQSALTRENEKGGYGIIDMSTLSVNNYYAN